MEMKPVQSSNISAIGYSPESQTLRVTFKSGATHDYAGVSAEKHEALMNAKPSIGKHFNAHIRGAHESTKVTGE